MKIVCSKAGKEIAVFFTFVSLVSIKKTNAVSSCQHEKIVSEKFKILQSPGFPNKFPHNFQCQWRLVADPAHRIKLQFTTLLMVNRAEDKSCTVQWISIVDNRHAGDFKICGKKLPRTFVSVGNVLIISLVSNARFDRNDYIGFKATYAMTLDMPTRPGAQAFSIKPGGNRAQLPSLAPGQTNLGNNIVSSGNINLNNIGQTQSERIEQLNRKRNMGIIVKQNPIFKPAESGENPTKNTPTTSSFKDVDNPVPESGSGSLSNELRIILIVIGVFVGCLLLFLLYRKRRYFEKVADAKNEEKTFKPKDISRGLGEKVKILPGKVDVINEVKVPTKINNRKPRGNWTSESSSAERNDPLKNLTKSTAKVHLTVKNAKVHSTVKNAKVHSTVKKKPECSGREFVPCEQRSDGRNQTNKRRTTKDKNNRTRVSKNERCIENRKAKTRDNTPSNRPPR